MSLYEQLDDTYQQLATRRPPRWLATVTPGHNLDQLVRLIRSDRPDTNASDSTLRTLIEVGRRQPQAMTVALYALAPSVRSRLSRSVTDEYRDDALTELAFVLLDSAIDGPRLAHRLVNRAHQRAHNHVQNAYLRGETNVVTVAPYGPDRFARQLVEADDIATTVARRVDLIRFRQAVDTDIASGQLTENDWAAYRDHRLRRELVPDARICSNTERVTACRAAYKLTPIINRYLHAA